MARQLRSEHGLIGKSILDFVVRASDVGLSTGQSRLAQNAAMFHRSSDISCSLTSFKNKSITPSSMDPSSTSESSIPPHDTVPGHSRYTGQNDLASQSLAGFLGSTGVNVGPSSHLPHPYTLPHGKL